jgi:hypothetical protein
VRAGLEDESGLPGSARQAIDWQRKALATNPRNPTYRQFLAMNRTAPGQERDVEADPALRQLAELTAGDPQFAVIEARLAAVMKGGGLEDKTEGRFQFGTNR